MTHAREAYVLWSNRNNDYYEVTKGGVPKVYTREQDAKYAITKATESHNLHCEWANGRYSHHYVDWDFRPLDLEIKKVRIELI